MVTTEQEAPASRGLTPLITGIIEDAQVLVRQQLSLFQSELKTDLNRGKEAALPLFAGLAVSLLAGIFLFLMAAELSVWLWPQLPIFVAYGVIGLVLGLIGVGLVLVGKNKFDAFSQVAEKSVEGLKENVEWKREK